MIDKTGSSGPDVIIGTPICRETSLVLDEFLVNQREIQQAYPGCKLVLATVEPDFIPELKQLIERYRLNAEVIGYETLKPGHARNRIWNIACGREALRRYALSQGTEYLLFLDGDMVYDPSVITVLREKIEDYDVVNSGYRLRRSGELGFTGCLLINRDILDRITFRCYEFENGQVIGEGELLDMDMFACRARVRSGIFVSIKHYVNTEDYYAIEPQRLGWFRTLTNIPLIRYILVKISIMIKYNIAYNLQGWLYSHLLRTSTQIQSRRNSTGARVYE